MQTQTFTIFPSYETAIIGKVALLKVCILNAINSRKVLTSMVLYENVNHLVLTVDNDLISIGVLFKQMIARLLSLCCPTVL